MRFLPKPGLWLLMLCAVAAWCQQAPVGSIIQNIAYVSYLASSGATVSDAPSNPVQTTVASASPNVVLRNSASTTSSARGQNVTFSLLLSNSDATSPSPGPLVLDGVTQQAIYVLDEIPANTHFASIVSASGATVPNQAVGARSGQHSAATAALANNTGGLTVFYHVLGAPSGQFTTTAPSNANIDTVGFAVPTLSGGQSYNFSFSVRVDDDASGNFSNTAAVTFVFNRQSQTVNSDTVTVSVPLLPPTIAYYTDTTFTQKATVATIGGTIHILAQAAACNLNPLVAETHTITITTNQTHDLETFRAVETGPNTGVFEVQSVPLADAHSTPVVPNDGILEVDKGEVLTATIDTEGCGVSAAATADATIYVDPYGVVFDSHTNNPVSGTQVTIIDVTGQGNGGHPGQPATVYLADGKTPAPSTLTTGSDGSYQFPQVATSTYKLTLVPPNGYKFPSSLSPLSMPSRKVIQPDSYGGSFLVSSLGGVVNFDVPLDEGPLSGLFIQKTPDEVEVDSDSLLGYTLEVTNNTGTDMPNTTVVDTLPPGFMYQLHSAQLGSVALADPAGGRGPVLTFKIGDLPIAADEKIHYYVRLLPQANNNNTMNTAYAASGITRSNTARATIKIIAGVFDTNGVIFGKVYADCNGNHVQDNNEPGIPGVRVYLDNGTFAITDEAGKYSIYGVTARLHGLRLDNYTLPAGFKPEVIYSTNAGDGKSLFVDMIDAELHRADFAVTGCSVESMKALSARAPAKGAAASEAAALLKKDPLLDRTDMSMEQRRGAATSAILDGAGSPTNPAQGVTQVSGNPGASTNGTAAALPAAVATPASDAMAASSAGLNAAASASPASASADGAAAAAPDAGKRPEPNEPRESEMQGGLRVEKLIRPGTTNDFDFIGLKDGQIVGSTQVNIALKGVLGTNFALSVNGKEISADHIGQRSTENSINLQAWLYIGLELNPGSNVVEAKMFDSFGNQRGYRKLTLIAPGNLAAILVEPANRNPVADGKTPIRVRVRLVDAHGVPVTSRTPVTLETTVGKWDAVDLNPREPGTQQFIEGGEAVFNLMPPMEPVSGKIAVSSGTLSCDVKLAFTPELRPLMAIGVVDQTLSFRGFSGAGASSASFYTLQNELSRLEASNASGTADYQAHVGTFIKGRIWGNTLLTMSYDSDKRSGDPMFRDAQPDDYYLVYGDSSTRGYEAQSTSRLYLRLDRGKDYVMYGDYNTGDSQNPAKVLSNINRSFTGFRIHQEDSHFQYTAFTTRDSVQQYVEEIPANGTSGPYLVTRMDVVLNSETVELLVRNRNQPSVILQDITETLLTDYSFDSLTGEILFQQPIPSFDPSGNPISIRVTYEFDNGGPKYWMSGIDTTAHFDKLRVGGTYYDDKTPSAGMRLWGTNGTYEFSKNATLVAEYARTWTPTLGAGSGVHAEFKQKNSKIDSRIYFGRTDASFDNPNAMLNQGSGESGANITYHARKHLDLHFEMIRSEATDTGVSQTGIFTTAQIDVNKTFSVEFGYRHAGAITSTESLSGTVPSTTTPTTGTSSTATSSSETSVPTSANDDLRAKITIKPPQLKKLSLYSEYEADMFDESKQMFAVGGNYQFLPKGKFYVRHELISSLGNLNELNGVQQQNSTVFGIDTTYWKDEHVFSEYRGIDAFSGRETEAAIGLRNVFPIRPGLKMSVSAENVKPLSGTATDSALALTGSLEYTASPRWKSSGRFEWRGSTTDTSILSSFGLAIKLNDNYTLLNRSVYSVVMPKTAGETDRLQIRVQNGVAFRPPNSNRFTLLTMLELKQEEDGTSTIVIPDRKVAILSAAINYQRSAKTVASFRYATKWSDDVTDVVDSTLDGHMTTARVTHDINPHWDVGVDSSALFSDHFNNIQYANGAEIGYMLRTNLWLSVGYNFTGFYDRDLSGEEATRRGPFVRLRFKFDESLFPFLKHGKEI
jgi:uncharacterized repeat protein (TIGR01451 family)